MITSNDKQVPYWRLSSFYFFYFALLGGLVPYWSLYLQSLNFSAIDIGYLMSILMVTKMIAPNVWGWLADHHVNRVKIIRLGSLLAVVTFLGLFIDTSFWWIALVMFAFGFFRNAVLPQFEVITLSFLGDRPHWYSRVRLWGSIGFILAVALIGAWLDYASIDHLPHMLLVLGILIWISSLSVSATKQEQKKTSNGQFLQTLKRKEVVAFFVVCLLMQLGHGPYYTFFSPYLDSYGYSGTAIGLLWALGVLMEVIAFWYMHKLLPKFGPRNILLFSLVLAVIRWWLIGRFPENVPMLLIAQCMHAATFGCFHAVAIELVRQFFCSTDQGKGQALYSSASFGAGGAIGAVLSGYAWESLGSYNTYLLASLVSLIALVITWVWMRPGVNGGKVDSSKVDSNTAVNN